MRPAPGSLEFRAFGLPHLEHRRAQGAPPVEALALQAERAAVGKDPDIAGTVSGLAAVFDSWSVDLGGFMERIRPGAFRASLDEGKRDVKLFHNHESEHLLSRIGNGGLSLKEDAKGLTFEAELPKTSVGGDVLRLVRLTTLHQMSFAFRVPEGGDIWEKPPKEGGLWMRSLVAIDLIEISSVAMPAYLATSIVEGNLAKARGDRLRRLEIGVYFDQALARQRERRARERRLRLLELGA